MIQYLNGQTLVYFPFLGELDPEKTQRVTESKFSLFTTIWVNEKYAELKQN